VLLALVLKLLTDKLSTLISIRLASTGLAASVDQLTEALVSLRDFVAAAAVGDRTDFANCAIAVWSRMLRLFRTGSIPANDDAYEAVSSTTPRQLPVDQNAQAAGLGNLGIALSLLEHGRARGLWTVSEPTSSDPTAGTLTTKASWTGAGGRPVFLVRGASEAIALEKLGAFANDNSIVIHADAVWQRMSAMGGAGARRPRRAPGRTGRIQTRHVSIDNLLEMAADTDGLRKNFVREVTL
jgi:hypothetical protein